MMLPRAGPRQGVTYREPIVLYYFQEMDLAETARILAMPEGTL